jgi:hypothetical protein
VVRPLNGTRTHPLSDFALAELRTLTDGPRPRVVFNPGVVNRLEREDLVEVVRLASPFSSHRGKLIDHLRITDAGRQRLLPADTSL